MLGFNTLPIRFFIWDDEVSNDIHEDELGDYRECTEGEFLDADGVIEYERFTVFENGCAQICLTKNPFNA